MANSAGICMSYFVEAGIGTHNMGAAGDTLKMALFAATATRTKADTAYSTTGELTTSGGYTQGGKTITGRAWTSDGSSKAYWTPNDGSGITWTSLTPSEAFDCAVIYNSSKSNKEISVHTFTSQNPAAADFTITFPTNDATNALLVVTSS